MEQIKKWLFESEKLLKALSECGQPGVCTFKQGNIDGCESVDYDDGDWKKVMGKGVPIPGISTDSILNLSTAMEQVRFAQELHEIHGRPEMKDALLELSRQLKEAAVINRDWTAINNVVDTIDEVLKPFKPYAKEFKVHLIAHAHIDMNWLWDMNETMDICQRDFKTVCDIMDENPDMRFSQSQTAVYDIVKKKDPGFLKE